MSATVGEPLIQTISDTAHLAAVYRARETDRPNAVFRDPLAARLTGSRGEQISRSLPLSHRNAWSWITRTWLFDRFIDEQVRQGVTQVVNLAAGLDARPYRMRLPESLRWVEVDLPPLIAHKEDVLRDDRPVCQLQRVPLDLSDVDARRELFADLGRDGRRTLILSEGLLVYLSPDEVGTLSQDLARPPGFEGWVIDLPSPRLLKVLRRNVQPHLAATEATLQFGPAEGEEFFRPHGWEPRQVESILQAAVQIGRAPPLMRLFALLPPAATPQRRRLWSGVCLLTRK
jgi:methyltransferase (TIGR00027 family)